MGAASCYQRKMLGFGYKPIRKAICKQINHRIT